MLFDLFRSSTFLVLDFFVIIQIKAKFLQTVILWQDMTYKKMPARFSFLLVEVDFFFVNLISFKTWQIFQNFINVGCRRRFALLQQHLFC